MAQYNLVPNPNFEEYLHCPNDHSNVHPLDNFYVLNWLRPTNGTSDYFNSCVLPYNQVGVPFNLFSDNQPARSGEGYCGFFVYYDKCCEGSYREYIQTQLIDTLEADTIYIVEFWVAPAHKYMNKAAFTTNEVGAYFSKERPYFEYSYTKNLNYTPQISNDSLSVIINPGTWTRVRNYFKATGNEKWITIGNFKNKINTNIFEIPDYPPVDNDTIFAYLFIEDVYVVKYSEIVLIDISSCVGDTVILDAYFGGAEYLWSTGDTTPQINVTTNGEYWVNISSSQGFLSDTAEVNFLPDTTFSKVIDTLICFNHLPAILKGSEYYDSYLWNTGSTNKNLNAHTEGLYILNATQGCNFFIDSFLVSITPQKIDYFYVPDTTLCPGDYFTVTAPDGFENYIWNTGATIQQIIIYEAGDYWVAYSDSCYNFSEEFTVKLDPYSTKNLELGDDIDLCSYTNFPITIDAGEWPAYLWSNGSTERYLQPNKPGEYSVTVYNNCGQKSDTIFINDCTEGTEDLLLMPNLSEGEFWLLNTPAEWTPQTTIYIYSMQGLVDKLQSTIDGFTRLDLTQYMKGAYWIIAEADGRQFFFKIIIQ
ncbi:MAG: T9SS type A sorting domain-containing protein [Chitinophagales bacterium]|nr:T9SS type A sorting domain-containing protein [Bacteroidota bacterium]MBP6715180.1 T9SS type A sorting domain-containing protein [Aliarcobacter sp.]MBP7400948.1 T9SS type A sorting domain-containing protein [Chitinophagales bacterium]MBK8486256.1 T9SS type A sorting domain-containing protein [Bacteroidota bacterium]MBK8683039.1 T9SS type A sorting domain-containing protein [Bacteroidota bacterium]